MALDQNDGAVTFLFENAERGGHFEYVPFLRDEDDERYEEVERLMDGETSRVLTALRTRQFLPVYGTTLYPPRQRC